MRISHNEKKNIAIDCNPESKKANARTAMSFTSPNPTPPDWANLLLAKWSSERTERNWNPASELMSPPKDEMLDKLVIPSNRMSLLLRIK
jgi:hypothetical protein